jgi:hypothetical protein
MIYVHYDTVDISVPIASITGIKTTKTVTYANFVFSSYENDLILKSYDFENAKQIMELLKQIPASNRTYDQVSNQWTIPYMAFGALFSGFVVLQRVSLCKHPSLEQWRFETTAGPPYKDSTPKAEDFFYSYSQPTSSKKAVSIDELVATLTGMFREIGVSDPDIATAYKRAARKLHPDVNGGDGSKMSELNMLWQQYKQLKGA